MTMRLPAPALGRCPPKARVRTRQGRVACAQRWASLPAPAAGGLKTGLRPSVLAVPACDGRIVIG